MTPGDPDHPAELVLPDGLSGPELLRRVKQARMAAVRPDALTIVGHGASGVAVLSLVLHQRRLGIRIWHAVCVGASGEEDPISYRPLPAPRPPQAATRVTFVPGDDPASRTWTEQTAAAWRAAGWPVDLAEPGQFTWRS